ncbi:hypothetical protein J3R83DRAFT_2382 [Lanmaoa asiatica]|nr:hypothetical protein J3R83DRAFT_2382 [Lanmaoa asiatica]
MSTIRSGALRWTAPELVVPEDALNRTTKSDIYSLGCISLQVLSGKKPWSEFQRDASVLLSLVQGHQPGRPKSREIDDEHWDFIQQCWMSIQDRPAAEDIITSLKQFLSCHPQFLCLNDLVSATTQADSMVSSNTPSLDLSSLVPIDELDPNMILPHREEGSR